MLDYEALSYALPEDVLKRKLAGDLKGAIELIDALLEKDIPEGLKKRLRVERKIVTDLPKEFNIPKTEALRLMREKIPDFTMEELNALELDRAIEYMYIDGEKRYLNSFRGTLLKVHPELAARANEPFAPNAIELDEAMHRMKAQRKLSCDIAIEGSVKVRDGVLEPDAPLRVHIPVPRECAQQHNIHIDTEGIVSEARQRTAFFEGKASDTFAVAYNYRNTVTYVDLWDGVESTTQHVYTNVLAPDADDLSEQYPHIVFTPYLKLLAEELAKYTPLETARAFYDYITTGIRYSFMRSYALIDSQAEYCAINGKGDCGIQALLFITLCRIRGIPARWQSGLCVDADKPGCHDWAQFYVEPYGWLFADPSYGGSAYRSGNEERRRFYFGNLDPYRMVANDRYQTGFEPPKFADRFDPYDNQSGEVESGEIGLHETEYATRYKTITRRLL